MPDQSSPPPQTKQSPAAAFRRPWYRLHWSTWIVVAAILAFFALVNLPRRVNNHDVFHFFEHGWPFVFLDRYDPLSLPAYSVANPEETVKNIRKNSSVSWAQMPDSYGFTYYVGEDEPIWLDSRNWTFSGSCYIYKVGLALDIALALVIAAMLAVAYEYWSRNRWHYSLRFLFILMLSVASAMAWWRTAANRVDREFKSVHALRGTGFSIRIESNAPVILRILIGTNRLHPFKHVCEIEGTSTESSPITDLDLEYLGEFPYLKKLDLYNIQITDKGLENIRNLENLEFLRLEGAKITDAGLVNLKKFPNLRTLNLDDTAITDDCINSFTHPSKLKLLEVSRTKITKKGVEKLRQVLPNCKVEWGWVVIYEFNDSTSDANDGAEVEIE